MNSPMPRAWKWAAGHSAKTMRSRWLAWTAFVFIFRNGGLCPRRLGSRRVPPHDLLYKAVHSVHKLGLWKKHERAISIHHPDAILRAVRGRFRAYRSLAAGPVDPDAANARCGATLYNLKSGLKRRHHERALHPFLH